MTASKLPILLLISGGILLLFFGSSEVVPPNPPVPPTPPGERFVLVIHESSERTAVEAATMAGLRRWLEQKSCHYLIVDKDLIEPSGANSEWLAPYLTELQSRKVALPALVVSVPPTASHNGAYLVAAELPGRAEEAISMVEEALNRE